MDRDEGDILSKSKMYKKIASLLTGIMLCCSIQVSAATISQEDDVDMDNEEIIINELNVEDVDSKKTNEKGPLRVSARNAIAIDRESKQVLFNQNGYEVVPMASTTKIMTSLVAIKFGDLDRKVVISKKAAGIRGSTVGYRAGEEITMRELLFGLMFKSGNDAAIAIAEDIGGSIEGFANIMNDYAKSIGVIDSHFESPHGLDSQKHYSSAYDLAILTAEAMNNPVFREITGEKTVSKDKYKFSREYQNINKILWRIPGANGTKTGYTGQAGKCLVSSVHFEDRDIIIVVLNCPDRWNQTEKIFRNVTTNYAFQRMDTKELVSSHGFQALGSIIEDSEFIYGYKESEDIQIQVFTPEVDVEEGDILGQITLKDENKEALKKGLKSNTHIDKEKIGLYQS